MAVETEVKKAREGARELPHASPRILRIQNRYQRGDCYVSVERAEYFTESWEETEGKGIPTSVRVSMALKNVYEKMTHYLDRDDRIAGYWTECFLGFPIDIERGVFNQVFEAELTKRSMLYLRLRSLVKGFVFLVRNKTLREFIRNQRIVQKTGKKPVDLGLKTMGEREINPYQIEKEDRRLLLRELLPYWKGKTVVDMLEKELTSEGLFSESMQGLTAIYGLTSRQMLSLAPCASIATFQGHLILDFDRVLREGLIGMRAEVQARKEGVHQLEQEQREFLESVDIALEGVMVFARRLAERIEREMEAELDPERREVLGEMLHTCRRVPLKPAGTFVEAVQSLWTVKTALELAHPVNILSFGRLDQSLYPYYKRDLEEGRITRDEAREYLEEFLLKIMSQNIRPESNLLGNFYHRFLGSVPVTVGGQTPQGEDATNDLTYLFLEAAYNSKAVTNINVRVHEGTPDELLLDVAKYLHAGTSVYALYNDEPMIEAMKRRGFVEEDARDYAIMGCVEALSPGKTGGWGGCALGLCGALDVTLRNGDTKLLAGTIRGEGLKTGDPDTFEEFDELLDAFLEQCRFFIKRIVDGSNVKDRLYAERMPAPCISAFMDGCLESMKDVTRGGAVYDLSGIAMVHSVANLVDSLYAIKKLIFEEKKYTFAELLQALDSDFETRQDIYRDIKKLTGMWGNGNPETDELARKITGELILETYKYRSYKDGPFIVYALSMTTHTIIGRLSPASPDGRRAATPYAASCNPYNVERSGVTAALRSVASLPFEDMMGAAVNMKFHPTGVGEGLEKRMKWVQLVRTYFQLGGGQIQPTVASAEMLREAQRDPDSYPDLIVKVGGYSTYYADLGVEIQDEIIARTEHC